MLAFHAGAYPINRSFFWKKNGLRNALLLNAQLFGNTPIMIFNLEITG